MHHAVPDRVTGVVVGRGAPNGIPSLHISWRTPTSDLTISQFQVNYTVQGTGTWKVKSVQSGPLNFDNLPPVTKYKVKVRAVSALGYGEWSAVSIQTTFSFHGKYRMHIHKHMYIYNIFAEY